MKAAAAIRWFKTNFQSELAAAVKDTPFTVDLLAAIAQQETGYLWAPLVERGLPVPAVLKWCVGDTIDARYKAGKNIGRSAIPRDRRELLAHPQGAAMFEIARQCLVGMAAQVKGYEKAARNPAKFCHGFGIFQYDLQFFKTNPDYFLAKRWEHFADCLAMAIHELGEAMKRQGWSHKSSLSTEELVHRAIAYNRGRSNPRKGFKQGHFNGHRYYGENIHEFLLLAQTTPAGPGGTVVARPGEAVLPVTRIDGNRKAVWFQIETSVNTALLRGYAFAAYLRAVPKAIAVPVATPTDEPDASAPQAVHCPRQPGTITRRAAPAGARSLNEAGAPGRTGESAGERVAELEKIIAWLDVERPGHKRYQTGDGKTFCNIYAHDYCHLAGVYLPRVWWTGAALVRIGRGETVPPLIGGTIDEQRANDLFRWLKSFGTSFGWRESAGLSELQETANLGAVCLIIARRKVDGRSGHVVMVVPETTGHRATRDSSGQVTHPLQSQAGARNFNQGKGARDWWKGSQFAEHAFWMHA